MSNEVKKRLDVHSEDIQEIMGHIPNWITRWGILIFFLLIQSFILGSYFLRYPTVVSTPLVLTTVNPPAPIVSQTNGRIDRWLVSNGDTVEIGTVVATIDDAANYDHVLHIHQMLEDLDSNWMNQDPKVAVEQSLSLGRLQSSYNAFQNSRKDYRDHITQDLMQNRIRLLEQRVKKEKNQYELLLEQWNLKRRHFKLVEGRHSRDSVEYFTNGFGLTKVEYELSLQRMLEQKAALVAFKSTLSDAEISLIQLSEKQIELVTEANYKLYTIQQSMQKNKLTLQTQIQEWIDLHVLVSPINGQITMTDFWSENQVIKIQERLATVVPIEETAIIARAIVPPSGLGKVSKGQKVKVKLSGFPYLEYGVLEGRVHSVSLVPDDQGYVAEISFADGMRSSYKEKLKFVQQMDGTAEIITEDTRLIYRILNPLRSILQNLNVFLT